MKKNMGGADRILRALAVAPLAVVAALLVGPGSVLGIVLLAVAAIMALTALVGFCPLYPLLGISTCRVHKTTAE